ncbi:hypothetical protein GEMRC1_011533 [Eukaryota sp. GEM-RC1]
MFTVLHLNSGFFLPLHWEVEGKRKWWTDVLDAEFRAFVPRIVDHYQDYLQTPSHVFSGHVISSHVFKTKCLKLQTALEHHRAPMFIYDSLLDEKQSPPLRLFIHITPLRR